jgi:RimJ/RimL family protein N-acetyltransferase
MPAGSRRRPQATAGPIEAAAAQSRSGMRQDQLMTELTDVSGAFGYGDSILAGERVRLRGTRDDDLPTLAKWEMDPGRMATLSSWVAPPSEASAKERVAKWSANEKDDLGFAIETLDDPPVLIGNIGLWGGRPQNPCATPSLTPGH